MTNTYTDKKLLELCTEYGNKALLWRKKFIGLLPEVNKRQLYEKAGCSSIFEFAKKKAGLSEKQVRLALNLNERFEDKPVLKNMLATGEVSINKLARVVSLATAQNEAFWANQAKILPNRSLETLVRDEKMAKAEVNFGMANQQTQLQIPCESLHVQTSGAKRTLCVPQSTQEQETLPNGNSTSSLKITPELESRLLKLQNDGHDISELITKLLDQRDKEIAERKQEQATKPQTSPKPPTRYIPAAIRKTLKEEYGTKCAIPHCKNHSRTIHHTARFALAQNHNPYFLAPLCKEHHDIAHSMDRKFFKMKERTT